MVPPPSHPIQIQRLIWAYKSSMQWKGDKLWNLGLRGSDTQIVLISLQLRIQMQGRALQQTPEKPDDYQAKYRVFKDSPMSTNPQIM